MAKPYNEQMVVEAIQAKLEAAPRGTKSKLAADVGVANATVTKWSRGHTSPDPDKWAAIEESLGMQPGDLRVAAGLPRVGGLPDHVPDGRFRLTQIDPFDKDSEFDGYVDEAKFLERIRPDNSDEARQLRAIYGVAALTGTMDELSDDDLDQIQQLLEAERARRGELHQ